MFLFQFVGFVQVKNLKQTSNRLLFTAHRFSITELKHVSFWDADGNRKWAIFTF